MIASLSGEVQEIWGQQIVLNVNGVGYLVTLTNSLLSEVSLGKQLSVFIFTKVKEDDFSLYGFQNVQERSFFQQLLSVSGIGVKTALALMDMPLHMISQAVHSEDVAYLSQAPGLGKKTASRLILELKGKIELELTVQDSPESSVPRSLQEEALAALESLGYDKPHILRFLNTTDQAYDTAEELVRGFLQQA